jgi:hypothetical protein
MITFSFAMISPFSCNSTKATYIESCTLSQVSTFNIRFSVVSLLLRAA